MRKRSGPKFDPCGMPGKIGLHDEDWPFKMNDRLESIRYAIDNFQEVCEVLSKSP